MKPDNIRKCGYCDKEIDESELIKETVNCWAPDVGHECDYIEEICPYCGWHSINIEDKPEIFID